MRHVAKPRSTPRAPPWEPPLPPSYVCGIKRSNCNQIWRSKFNSNLFRRTHSRGPGGALAELSVHFLARYLRSGSIDSRFSIAAFDFSSFLCSGFFYSLSQCPRSSQGPLRIRAYRDICTRSYVEANRALSLEVTTNAFLSD